MIQPKTPSNVSISYFNTFIYDLIEIKKTEVLYRGKAITTKKKNILPIDPSTFKALSFGFFADRNYIYGLTLSVRKNSEDFYLTPIPQLDRASFKTLNLYYATDKNNTYFADGGKLIKGIDYKPLDKKIPEEKLEIETANTSEQYKSDFIINATAVYFRGRILKGADPNSFAQMGKYWAKDKHRVFSINADSIRAHDKFDAPSFIVFSKFRGTDKYKPASTVFFNHAPEALVDHKSYQDFFLNNPHLKDYWYFKAKDKNARQDNSTAEELGYGYHSIGDDIFYWKKRRGDQLLERIVETTVSNFKLLEHGYATNGNWLILLRDESWSHHMKLRMIKLAPKHEIKVLSDAWVFDGIYFYYKAIKKFKADKASFRVLNHIHAYDKGGLICEGVRKKGIKVSASVKSLGGAYIKNEDTYYYMGKARKNKSFDDSEVKIINDFIIMSVNGSAFNHGKYLKNIGEFKAFRQLENGNWGDGIGQEWTIGSWGFEKA